MKTPLVRIVVIGIGLAAGAFLLMGQARAPQFETGRFDMRIGPDGREVFVVDTATGAVKRIVIDSPRPEGARFGVPFERLPNY